MRTLEPRLARAAVLLTARQSSAPLSESIERRDELVDRLQQFSRRRKYAMKLQQKIDRALESYVRINFTEWDPDAPEGERKKINAQVTAMIKQARADNKKLAAEGMTTEAMKLIVEKGGDIGLLGTVDITDRSRMPSDDDRKKATAEMEKLAAELPVVKWIESVPGAGVLGLALIVAEAGSLDRYPNPAKLWKRLGYAPYDGYAGSTWKRESWRPRKLTKEEWIDAPFSGERYAAMYNIATWLVNAQWVSAKKAESDEGKPNGFYGEIYAARRARTLVTHPDWTPGHRRADALRVTFKKFLLDLWECWIDEAYLQNLGQRTSDAQWLCAGIAAAGHFKDDAHEEDARGGIQNLGQEKSDAQESHAETAAVGQQKIDAQAKDAHGGSKNLGQRKSDAQQRSAETAAAGQEGRDAQDIAACGGSENPGQKRNDAQPDIAETAAAGQGVVDAQKPNARSLGQHAR